MMSDTVPDLELISRFLDRHGDDKVSCCPEVVVSIPVLSETPLRFSPKFNARLGLPRKSTRR